MRRKVLFSFESTSFQSWKGLSVVMMAWRIHLFPCRTQKLSFNAPKVVGGSLPARIGRRHAHGGLAQLGERLPYKQRVTGSSPVSSIFYNLLVCGYGGTGRRARFRFLCPCGVEVRILLSASLWLGRKSNFFLAFFVPPNMALPSLFRASEYYIETTVEAVAKWILPSLQSARSCIGLEDKFFSQPLSFRKKYL